MNAGRLAKMKALEEAIADEKSVEDVYSCRDQIYDILKVIGSLYSSLILIRRDILSDVEATEWYFRCVLH